MKNFTKQFKTIEQIFLVFLFSIFLNINLHSQTSGPTAPDFKGFTPINNNNLVNEFDGSFNYSIPVLSLPSGTKEVFNMALTYRSGMSPNEDASWVGFGWNLNPGIIQRQLKGFPDEFNKVKVIYFNDILPNITETRRVTVNGEYNSNDSNSLSIGANVTYTYLLNNYTGLYTSTILGGSGGHNLGGGYKLGGGLSYNYDSQGNTGTSVQASLTKSILFRPSDKKRNEDNSKTGQTATDDNNVKDENHKWEDVNWRINAPSSSFTFSNDWGKGQLPMSYPNIEYSYIDLQFKVKLGYLKYGIEAGLPLLMKNQQTLKQKYPFEVQNVSGYLHSKETYGDNKVIMDYYCENEMGISQRNKFLPIPFSNVDNFSVSGPGLQGSFKHNLIQNVSFRPVSMEQDKTNNKVHPTLGLNISPLGLILGFDTNFDWLETKISDWPEAKLVLTDPNVNFMSLNVNNKSRAYLSNSFTKFNGELSNSLHNYKSGKYDLTYLNNIFKPISTELSKTFAELNSISPVLTSPILGIAAIKLNNLNNFNKNINNNTIIGSNSHIKTLYNYSTDDKQNKIVGFEVTNTDGTLYIYDLGVKHRNEGNLNYGISKIAQNSPNSPFSPDGKIIYVKPDDIQSVFTKEANVTKRTNVRKLSEFNNEDDRFVDIEDKFVTGNFTQQEYYSAFHLTKIYYPNYVDISGNGPSLDDIGDYVQFNYRAAYSNNNKYQWRDPYLGLKYEKNKLSNQLDDIGSVRFGEKDIYYLESIETKTHIAVFVTNLSTYGLGDGINVTGNYTKDYIFETNGSTFDSYLQEIILQKMIGSGNKREDCLPALENEDLALQSNYFAPLETINIESQLQYLERILLFSKDLTKRDFVENTVFLDKLVNTVSLDYDSDYPIWSNMPNSKNSSGKLTLKKVYTDNEYVQENKIHPYEFCYNVESSDLENFTPAQKTSVGFDDLLDKDQAPSFNYWNIDRWNNYNDILLSTDLPRKEFALNNNFSIQSKTIQGGVPNTFDHPAWNLKKITMPSKSEIFAIYEENEYSYVQNRHPYLMFNNIVKDVSDGKKLSISKLDILKAVGIDVEDNGIGGYNLSFSGSVLGNDVNGIISEIMDFWNKNAIKKKIYYKMLFEIGDEDPLLTYDGNLFNLRNEYITGYNYLETISNSGNDIVFEFNDILPYQKCESYVRNNKFGFLENRPNDVNYNGLGVVDNIFDYTELILPTMDKVEDRLDDLKVFAIDNATDLNGCKDFYSEYSFIKLPLPDFLPKKGGGVRVKKVVSVDRFDLENEESDNVISANLEPKVYGSEYFYVNSLNKYLGEFNLSSGVAVNEPSYGNEDNALKEHITTLDNESREKFIPSISQNGSIGSGGASSSLGLGLSYNKKQKEFDDDDGPIGEGILPYATVNYSKVYTKPLIIDDTYKNKTISIKEFHTVKKYPFDREYKITHPLISGSIEVKGHEYQNIQKVDNKPWWQNGLSKISGWNISRDVVNLSQNYQFILNDMHGKPLSTSTFSYNDINNEDEWKLGTQTNYEYFDLGAAVPIIENIDNLTAVELDDYSFDWLGLNVSINSESRQLTTSVNSLGIDVDAILNIPSFIPMDASFSANYSYKQEKYSYFTTNKIIELPSLLKRTTNITDGIKNVVENIAFDSKTGEPVIQRTNSQYTDYDKSVLTNPNVIKENLHYYKVDIKSNKGYEYLSNKSDNENVYIKSDVDFADGLFHRVKFYMRTQIVSGTPHKYIEINQPSSTLIAEFDGCGVRKYLKKGDLIKITNSTNFTANYFINYVDCFNIHLIEESGSGTPSGLINTEVNMEVIKSVNKNQISSEFVSLNLFKPDTIDYTPLPKKLFRYQELDYPINYGLSNEEWGKRQEIVDIINSELSIAYSGCTPSIETDVLLKDLEESDFTCTDITSGSPVQLFDNDGSSMSYSINGNMRVGYRLSEVASYSPNISCPNSSGYYPTNYYGEWELSNLLLYKPYFVSIYIKLNDRFTLGANDVVQKFSSLVYKCVNCTTCVDDDKVPKFKLNVNGDIEFEPVWISGSNFVYNECTDDDPALLFSELGSNQGLFINDNKDIYDEVHDRNPRQLSHKLEGFNFYNKLKMNLINIPNENVLNPKYTIVGSQALEYKNDIVQRDNLYSMYRLEIPTTGSFKGSNDLMHVAPNTDIDWENDLSNKSELSPRLFFNLKSELLPFANYSFYKSSHATQYNNNNVFSNQGIAYTPPPYGYPAFADFLSTGLVQDTFKLFNWVDIKQNNFYNKNNQNLIYSYNRDVISSNNILNIESGLKTDDYLHLFPNHTLDRFNPELAVFQSFEDYQLLFLNNSRAESLMSSMSNESHTGNLSLKMNISNSFNNSNTHILPNWISVYDLNLLGGTSSKHTDRNYIVEAWVKFKYDYENTLIENDEVISKLLKTTIVATLKNIPINKFYLFTDPSDGSSWSEISDFASSDLKIVQQVGDWYLVRGELDDVVEGISGSSSGDRLKMSIKVRNTDGLTDITLPYLLIDDVRLMPASANMTSYIVDRSDNNKITAILDNSHIPIRYIYNDKGELTKQAAATIVGNKLIKESYSNTKVSERDDMPTGTPMFSNGGSPLNNFSKQQTTSKLNSMMGQTLDSSNIQDKVNIQAEKELEKVNESNSTEIKSELKSKLKTLSKKKLHSSSSNLPNAQSVPQGMNEGNKIDYNLKHKIFNTDSLRVNDSTKTNKN